MNVEDIKDLQQFQYNVTLPYNEQFKKRNKVDIAREKLVDKVKKFKRQAPRVGNLIQDNPARFDDLKLAEEDQVEQTLLEQIPHNSRLKFIYSRNNYSEIVQQSKFFNRIRKYHQDRYHGPILSFSSISISDEDDKEEEEVVINDVQQKKRQFLKRRKRVIMYDQDSSSASSSSFRNSTTTINNRRRKLISSISNQHNKRRHKKRKIQLQLLVNEQQRKRQDERLKIRHRMMNFVIPADWTCITGSKDNTTKSRDIFSHELLTDQLTENIQSQKLSIEFEIERIKKNQLLIQEYKQKLMKLNQNLNRLSLRTSSTSNAEEDEEETKTNKSPTSTKSNHQYSHLIKSTYLLKQAYRQHRKLVRKIEKYRKRMNLKTRLDYLQVKVQKSLYKQTSLSQRWTFPIGLLLIITLSFFILT